MTTNLVGVQANSQIGGLYILTDLVTFINATASLVLAELPLQSLDSAIILVDAYISNVGGWIPVNPLDPTGLGALFNGFTEQQAADEITEQEFETIYDLNFNVTVTLNVQMIAKLTTGLSLVEAAGSMANQVSLFLSNTINNSPIPLRVPVSGVGTQVVVDDFSLMGGYTTPAIRLAIAADIVSTTKEVDYKGLALQFVQNTYGVDNTWNVESVYAEVNQSIAIIIRKYIDVSYTALDSAVTTIYVMNVSPVTYQIVTGVIIK